jgi:predicted HicB family RNase H-like nuclease
MNNTMTLDGFTAVITYDPDKDWFRGVIQGLNGSADFHGRAPDELRREFKASLDFFIEVCEKRGRPVRKPASGKFMVRLPPDLHQQAATTAQAEGVSLNALVERAIRHEIHAG